MNKRKAIKTNKAQYTVRDQYGIERPLPPNFQPVNDDQIRYIVRVRNVSIIRRNGNETKTFTPASHIPLQAVIINAAEILHQTTDWITIEMIQNHLSTLNINRTETEITDAIRSIYKKAQSAKNDYICNFRKTIDGKNEFKIRKGQ